ncbi:MAG TPA: hypothetical protein VMH27_09735 [Puia sp.]|nr:hypothetical protein [Puia sp.]
MELLVKLALLLAAAPLAFLLYRPLTQFRVLRILVISGHALILTGLTLFVFNQSGWRWTEEISLLSETRKSAADTGIIHYINRNFVLVDVAKHRELIDDNQEDPDYHAHLAVVDHQKLEILLRILCDQQNWIDRAIIDIDLNSMPYDSSMEADLRCLSGGEKLILTRDPDDSMRYVHRPEIYANVREDSYDDYLVSHSIFRGSMYSLPYLLYLRQHPNRHVRQVWKDRLVQEYGDQRSRFIVSPFIPKFALTKDEFLTGDTKPSNPDLPPDSNSSKSSQRIYSLGEFALPINKAIFVKELQTRKRLGLNNNILIGTYSGNSDDLHETLYGPMHGPTIILNILYAMEQGQDQISWAYVMLLIAGFATITFVLFNQGMGIAMLPSKWLTWFNPRTTAERNSDSIVWRLLIALFYLPIYYFFTEEVFLPLILLLTFLCSWLTGHSINILPLILYFAVLKGAFSYARKIFGPGKPIPADGRQIKEITQNA